MAGRSRRGAGRGRRRTGRASGRLCRRAGATARPRGRQGAGEARSWSTRAAWPYHHPAPGSRPHHGGRRVPAPGRAPLPREGPVPASSYVISLDDAGRAELEAVSRRATAPFRLVLRARIVLLAAGGTANSTIAARLRICEDTARKWRRRYCEQGITGLADAPRPGRPRKFPARVVAEVKALACELPPGSGKPLALWPAGPAPSSPAKQ